MAAGVPVLNSRSLDEVISGSTEAVLVEFGAEWCPPCRAMEPVLHALAVEYQDRLRIYTVDADADPGLVSRFDVAGLPTLLVFRDGQLVKRLVGARGRSRLAEDLAGVLS
ncbi:MAG: thioredoxin family protein [Actinomycetota bacterium]|nr:thioredoxin family protein [Actinomycetota bacterium]